MRTIWHSLAWKEWHEHKWKLAALVAITWSASATVLLSFTPARDAISSAPLMALLCMIPLTAYVAAGDATGETARGTLPCLQALPVAPRNVAVCRLTLGIASCVVPIVAMAVMLFGWSWFQYYRADGGQGLSLSLPWTPNGEPLRALVWSAKVISVGAILVSSVYLWTAAFAVGRRDEVSGCALAFAVMAAAWTVAIVAGALLNKSNVPAEPWLTLELAVGSALPGGFSGVIASNGWQHTAHRALFSCAAVASHAALAIWFLRRFGIQNESVPFSQAPRSEQMTIRNLRAPRRSRLTAIVWKQLREMGPPLLTGLAAVIFLAAANFVSDPSFYGWQSDRIIAMIAEMSFSVGFVVILTIGIGLFLNDLSPKLNEFWRSQPISPNLWYWVKYLTAPLVLFAVLALSTLPMFGWKLLVAYFSAPLGQFLPKIAVAIIAGYLALYSAAIATTCLVRQAIYAAILAICAVIAPFFLIWFAWLGAARCGWTSRPDFGPFDSISLVACTGILATTALAATIIGWLAVRNDWGRKNV